MMIIKAYAGNQGWELWEALSLVSFQGHHCEIAVPAGEGYDHDFWADERFPTDDVGMMTVRTPGQIIGESDGPTRFFHWTKWYDGNQMMMLVTDGPVYICNASGDTIEALAANAKVEV